MSYACERQVLKDKAHPKFQSYVLPEKVGPLGCPSFSRRWELADYWDEFIEFSAVSFADDTANMSIFDARIDVKGINNVELIKLYGVDWLESEGYEI